MEQRLDIVIPCLNAAGMLPATLAGLGGGAGVIVADGGSADGTADVAAALGARVLRAPRGRGPQCAAGAAAGGAPWLLFLHADTRLGAGWREAVARHIDAPDNAERAGYFRLRFDSASPMARRWERAVAWRSRGLGLPYGDQGLLIARPFYETLGGFRPLPLMEDVDLVRRVGRRRLVPLDAEAISSAVRYERDGWLLRPARNLACLSLYFVGVPPRLIRRLYG
ncbi:TIGR04283 family arsenosugar biosynthesis glycosyltransferase [Azospirillum sp. TSO22-1]|uniref:TIGR04283 family arsenosugar biosynthesis glycosyltransferase n=1 Tax=Azospirillum sp. TSO22-1 TaxID=716789 RepID=UPI000D60B79A|nr:TIGR04283 family arsenosugar biosynthesis glycosyltransferase [Azospirillum sp. TSO22-1]PWC38662.1 glycosyl transferase family 2 [Azospirillum sp. TSO22-1]